MTHDEAYQTADALLTEGGRIYAAMLRQMETELADKEAPKPTVHDVIDLREIGLVEAVRFLQSASPYATWKAKMWEAHRAGLRAEAYVNFAQAHTEISNWRNRGLNVFDWGTHFDGIRDRIDAHLDEMGQAGLHKG